jgi:hypothetical protein
MLLHRVQQKTRLLLHRVQQAVLEVLPIAGKFSNFYLLYSSLLSTLFSVVIK